MAGWQIAGSQISRTVPPGLDDIHGLVLVVHDEKEPPAKAEELKKAMAAAKIFLPIISRPEASAGRGDAVDRQAPGAQRRDAIAGRGDRSVSLALPIRLVCSDQQGGRPAMTFQVDASSPATMPTARRSSPSMKSPRNSSARPGVTTCVAWTSEGFPVDNNGHADERANARPARRTPMARCSASSSSRRLTAAQPPHRLNRLCCILSGEIDMEMDGRDVHLKAGDVIGAARHDP